MIEKSDPFYGAMLVESARLHLGTVMAGQESEIFFSEMMRIIESKVYLGYKTLRGKDVKLRGMKDFIHNVHYGLGVRDMSIFVCAIVKSAFREKSKNKYGYQFLDWLKKNDKQFALPDEIFKYRMLLRQIRYQKNVTEKRKFWLYSVARLFYQDRPDLLDQIGPGKKYKTIEECYFGEGMAEKMQTLKPIKIFKNPTAFQVEHVAEILFQRLGRGKTRLLIYKLIQQCKNASIDSDGNGAFIPDVDNAAAGAGWDYDLGDAEA